MKQKIDSQFDCNERLEALSYRVTTTSLPGGQTGVGKMATKGHACNGKNIHQQQRNDVMDKQIIKIIARMDELALHMQHRCKDHIGYMNGP
jgi:hypothetical protein